MTEWFDTSGYDKKDNRRLPIGIDKKYLVNLKMN